MLPTDAAQPPPEASSGSRPETSGKAPAVTAAVFVVAVLVFGLAYYSPITTSGSDPAIALLASQALIDHRSIRLDPYRGRLAAGAILGFRSLWPDRLFRLCTAPRRLGLAIVSVRIAPAEEERLPR